MHTALSAPYGQCPVVPDLASEMPLLLLTPAPGHEFWEFNHLAAADSF